MTGIIVLWSGAIVDIPAGWSLCDGGDGRPDFRDHFIIGAGNTYAPGDTDATNVAADAGIPYYAACYIIKD